MHQRRTVHAEAFTALASRAALSLSLRAWPRLYTPPAPNNPGTIAAKRSRSSLTCTLPSELRFTGTPVIVSWTCTRCRLAGGACACSDLRDVFQHGQCSVVAMLAKPVVVARKKCVGPGCTAYALWGVGGGGGKPSHGSGFSQVVFLSVALW